MNYFIITFSKVHHKITEAQREKLLASDTNQIELPDKSIVKVNSIAEILPENKYFEAYPDKRPERVYPVYENKINMQTREPTLRAKELMQKGLDKFNREKV